MRKNLVSLFPLLFLLGLVGLTSCKKENTLGNGTQFRATMEDCISAKTILNGTALEWVGGDNPDQIAVYGTAGCGLYTATPQIPATVAVFNNVSGETGNAPFRAFYPTTLTTDGVNITLPATQTYVEGSIHEFPMYTESNNEELAFRNLCGVLKLHLTKTGVNISSITITVASETMINGTFSVDYNGGDPELTYSANGTNTTTLTCATPQSIAEGRDFYIYLPEGDYSGLQIAMNTDDSRYCVKTANTAINVTRSQYTLITLGESNLHFNTPFPDGVLPGLFTINGNGDQVHFSQGNLQYQASTGTWQFAGHQYGYIGSPNANISATNTGWIDLFGWGTGSNPTLSSTNYSDYGTSANWGNNAISNGGNAANQWHTLSQAEWTYLLNTRSNTTNLGTADARYAKGKVNNVRGVIIFPDGYTHPACVAVPTGINSTGSTGLNQNNYTIAQWGEMEAAGAVFLPAAGYRVGTSVFDACNDGYYWSSGLRTTAKAWGMAFDSDNFYIPLSFNRNYGFSVRLVQDNN